MFDELKGKSEVMERFGLTREMQRFSDEDSCSDENEFNDDICYNEGAFVI